ncbi:MAG TPA: glycosyltransferase family A protein [Polyangiales bacterium]
MRARDAGAVVIGRNEGERLQRCLRSLVGRVSALVYVDSASTDDSVAFARGLGVEVVELDLSIPFTAARARNEGFTRLRAIAPEVEFVQFVDGDCEVLEGWIEFARDTLAADPGLVAVTGVRRERHPERSVYNELCDVEWRMGPFGETNRFGGDVMIRAAALSAVGGYNPRVIAAEDDEVALRLYQNGGKILRVDRAMTLHDAAIYHLSQWWQRAKRAGHGYAQVSHLHGAPPANKFKTEKQRVLTWGVGVPAVLLALAPPSLGASLLLAGVYPLRALRVASNSLREGMSPRASAVWGLSCAFTSFPEAVGMAKFHVDRLLSRAPKIIEYKGPKAQ